ncbi:YcaO-like family protein [Gloeobacter violaceus]|uniref:Gll1299 protein n=1 Tax=Gloeobacter violaceus (strain ATCC 29082 / PCC 7421) TaxID=251221 RepID=Q7NL27_GLOVI|nr:gll1299 [Gloeobacter violaceus PCC 7421]
MTETTDLYRMSSSLRVVALAETLQRARAFASRLGIIRVTDTTRLDCIGIPVFASIRPTALPGSLCVNAGKGLRPEEARVGAYMEAIEFAMAEYGRSAVDYVMATPRDVLDGRSRPEAILDFCPVFGAQITLDDPMPCVEAEELLSSTRCLVPAELVYVPAPAVEGVQRHFGSSSNGLCSGNSVWEASVHGLAEVIERDIQSFCFLHDTSVLVDIASLPPQPAALARQIGEAGFTLRLRYVENIFELPYFAAYVMEPDPVDAVYICGGFGCHPFKEIAAVRAICEAVQGRLSFIHGGRDDLIERHRLLAQMNGEQELAFSRKLAAKVSRPEGMIGFEAIGDRSGEVCDLSSAWEVLVAAIRKVGIAHVCRVVFTQPHDPVQVLKLIVPRLEMFDRSTRRIGPRLRDHARFHE